MRISDWSSDVCSSDLLLVNATASKGVDHRIEKEVANSELPVALIGVSVSAAAQHGSVSVRMPNYGGGPLQIERQAKLEAFRRDAHQALVEIGRASCRERVCQAV